MFFSGIMGNLVLVPLLKSRQSPAKRCLIQIPVSDNQLWYSVVSRLILKRLYFIKKN